MNLFQIKNSIKLLLVLMLFPQFLRGQWSEIDAGDNFGTLTDVYAIDDQIVVATGNTLSRAIRTTDGNDFNAIGVASPTADPLNAIHFAEGTTFGGVVGDASPDPPAIRITTNNGAIGSWTNRDPSISVSLFAVYFVDESIGYACGQGGNIFKTTNGGVDWVVETMTSGTASTLRGISAPTANVCYVAGANGTVRKTMDGGTTIWSAVASPTVEFINDVYFLDELTGYIVVSNGAIFKTMNGGTDWVQQTSGVELLSTPLRSIDFVDENNGYVVGDGGTILRTMDGGDTWIDESVGGGITFRGVSVVDANTAYAVGDNGSSESIIYKRVPTPDISVTDGLDPFSNGETLDFGPIAVGTPTSVTFTIENTGAIDLNITDITLDNEIEFTLGSIPSLITPGSSETFDVDFMPSSESNFSDVLTIMSDDPDTPNYTLNLEGSGFAAGSGSSQLEVRQGGSAIGEFDIVDFGSADAFTNGNELVFTIVNTGGSDLVLDDTDGFPAIEVTPDFDFVLHYEVTQQPVQTTIPSGGNTTFRVRFTPQSASQSLDAQIFIYIINEGPTIVNITGEGLSITLNAPSNLTATPNNDSEIVLNWDDNSGNEDGFEIWRSLTNEPESFIFLDDVSANVTTYTDITLAANQRAYYFVEAFSISGSVSNASNVADATTKNPPAVPQNLIAETFSQSQINLSWTDVSSTETGFGIERSSDNNTGFVEIATVGSNITTYQDTGLDNNTVYVYRVRALNAAQGDSDYSNVSGARTADIPLAPSNLKLNNDNGNIVLNWQDNSNNEAIFQVERANSLETEGRFEEIARLPADVVSFVDTLTTPNQIYIYQIRASNANGISTASDTASLETPPDPEVDAPTNAPQELVAEPVSNSEIAISWRPVTGGRASRNTNNFIRIEISISPSGPFREVTQVPTSGNRFQFTGLNKDRTYYIRIRQGNDGGNSPYSQIVSASPDCRLLASVSDDKDDVVVSICDGKSALLLLNTNVIEANYQWTRNGLTLANSNQKFYYATENGEYNCNITAGECTKTASVSVVLTLRESLDVNIDQIDNILEADLTNANAYQWYRDEIAVEGANAFRYEPTEDGLYYVVASQEGCSATSNFIFYTTTGINEVISNEIQAYPNPIANKLNLIWENEYLGIYQLNLYDMQGKQYPLISAEKSGFILEESIDLSSIPSGNYLLEMVGDDFRAVKKVIKE